MDPRRSTVGQSLLLGLVALTSVTCVDRPLEPDFSEEVERVCGMLCEQNVSCHEPPLFETVNECFEVCISGDELYTTDACGAARRAVYECVGQTSTCEAYLDTHNVDAEDYTCKSEKDAMVDACI